MAKQKGNPEKGSGEKKQTSSKRKVYTGVVVNNKAAGTVRVRVETKMAHPLYKKIIKRHKNYLVHTNEVIEVGSTVMFRESRPISGRKNWVVIKVLGVEK